MADELRVLGTRKVFLAANNDYKGEGTERKFVRADKLWRLCAAFEKKGLGTRRNHKKRRNVCTATQDV